MREGLNSAGIDIRTLARIELPIRLAPEDYIVEVYDRDAGGREVERHRYFFRVRAGEPQWRATITVHLCGLRPVRMDLRSV